MWRLVYAVPSWILFEILIDIPLMLLGWILIPIMAGLKRYEVRQSQVNTNMIFAWKDSFMWVWGNEEDGILGGAEYFDPDISEWRHIVLWCANRNPTNNLRYVPGLSLMINKERVGYIGNMSDIKLYDTPIPQWFFAWQGFYTGFWWQFVLFGKLKRFWIGFKIYPTDTLLQTSLGYRLHGAGFALQFKSV